MPPVHDHADLASCKSTITSHRVHLLNAYISESVLHVNRDICLLYT
jgi:hypothetical protein